MSLENEFRTVPRCCIGNISALVQVNGLPWTGTKPFSDKMLYYTTNNDLTMHIKSYFLQDNYYNWCIIWEVLQNTLAILQWSRFCLDYHFSKMWMFLLCHGSLLETWSWFRFIDIHIWVLDGNIYSSLFQEFDDHPWRTSSKRILSEPTSLYWSGIS